MTRAVVCWGCWAALAHSVIVCVFGVLSLAALSQCAEPANCPAAGQAWAWMYWLDMPISLVHTLFVWLSADVFGWSPAAWVTGVAWPWMHYLVMGGAMYFAVGASARLAFDSALPETLIAGDKTTTAHEPSSKTIATPK